MAIKVEKRVVCDLGDKHLGEVKQWRITVDRESKVLDLCAACSRPLVKLWDGAAGPARVPVKMKVVTLSEIEAQKHKETPATG